MNETLDKEQLMQFTYHSSFDGIYHQLKDIEAFITATDKFLADSLKINKNISDNHDQIKYIFPDILWRTTFLHCYFLLELSLDHVCKNLQQTEDFKIMLTDVAGKGISRASTYLKKVCNITEPFTDNKWRKLSDYNKLRNIFVHGDGMVARKAAVELAKRNEGLLIGIIDFDVIAIRFSKDFTLKALQTIDDFFHILQKSMQKSVGLSLE
jgi:hypothetical protein